MSHNFDRIFINGNWVPSTSAEKIAVIDSHSEEEIGEVPAGTPEDIDRAVAAARAAAPGWAATSHEVRADLLRKVADAIERRTDELAEVISQETGMVTKLTGPVQVGMPVRSFRRAADFATDYEFETRSQNSVIVREPIGVVGCITPWNFPLHQAAAKIAYALAAGCTVVLKPSEIAPIDTFILAECTVEAGLPPGVFNVVSGLGPVVGEALAAHPDVDMVSLTGSTRAGKRVAELGAKTVKRVTLELGGKSPNILLDDLSPDAFDAAVRDGVAKSYFNSGQTCAAMTRMLVPKNLLKQAERVAVETAESLKFGDPSDADSEFGPLASAQQLQRVRSYIETGVQEGATLLTGGTELPEGVDKGYYVRPTVFSDVKQDMTIAQEEIFGPVLSILPYDDEEDAVAIANDVVYGLYGGVSSADPERARAVARRIKAGQVEVNGGEYNPDAPFGGYKQSGLGREYGSFGLEEFLEVKSIQE